MSTPGRDHDGSAPVAVVSGAAAGIGLACVRELRSQGWLVAGCDLRVGDAADLDAVVDVADPVAVARFVDRVTRELGPPTGVVSAAGYVEEIPLDAISPAAFRRMLGVHLGGLHHLTRATLPAMVARGGGAIVAVASELAIAGGEDAAHYVTAKGALLGLTRSLAAESASAGVLVNVVAPGPTDTAMLAAGTVWRDPAYLATLPTGALVRPEEIALTAAFLLSGRGALTGQVVSPNAGTVI
ncbi:SDR family NAD(P)-dependent oxidoreductase [Embleya scabrispora]|uniref:SDR family NAD(P)-dependent oxidoreductase n=1 Tax=Embleya scabrispora TaxID=159449 RepID=UPI00035EC46B|nr:SDR family oxidoreductase [Embleya scabrispora]MYS84911.1 SDR family oxidoreductase [Streptomyces sp. SID5474]